MAPGIKPDSPILNRKLAMGVVRTIRDRLAEGRPATPDELARFDTLMGKLGLMMTANCQGCADGIRSDVQPISTFANQRSRWFLRLLVARFVTAASGEHLPPRLPRTLIQGYEDFLVKVLGQRLYDDLNARAGSFLKDMPDCPDPELWQRIIASEDAREFVFFSLCRLMLRLNSYGHARQVYLTVMGTYTSGRRMHFSRRNFDYVFRTLFDGVMRSVARADAEGKLDFHLGPGALERLHEVWAHHLECRIGDDEVEAD